MVVSKTRHGGSACYAGPIRDLVLTSELTISIFRVTVCDLYSTPHGQV